MHWLITDNMVVTQLPPPIQPAQVQQQLTEARLSSKKVRRAAGVATTDAWMIAVFAATSFICGLFGDASGVIIGMAMAVIAYVEFDGAARIRRLDVNGPKRLGYNQIAFACVIILYALWSLHSSTVISDLKAHGAELPEDYQEMLRLAMNVLYASLIAIAILAQGGTALYYFSREKYLRKYVAETPAWIIEMQRSGGSL